MPAIYIGDLNNLFAYLVYKLAELDHKYFLNEPKFVPPFLFILYCQ